MGLNITEIGTHSLRKGVATALNNTPGGPQAVSVWLRAGWSLGGEEHPQVSTSMMLRLLHCPLTSMARC
ncbi:hypothetical protein H257_16008 [Aphanomyces astaci]|uniref:Uncharacterized protein n=1 Tax=Aphanomyces astaci TaxID=112090 RepID=W4FMF6_APHAT|nr:hypothetical protein H257_16008 [Aphanomyces astaci]ETV67883.1 hypothetical protein H257_16008 [Aphanomyces astaci]|eukprot:XP_009842628.1 hypothetical protein H257_16008 [Aphanomyces astaci]